VDKVQIGFSLLERMIDVAMSEEKWSSNESKVKCTVQIKDSG
jgi:hypothetical protein